jgi:hypothetical protein
MPMNRIVAVIGATFALGLVAGASGPAPPSQAPPAPRSPVSHPRLLIAESDSFSSVEALKAKYAAGERPSDDLPGWALSYVLTGDEAFARRAVDEMRRVRIATSGGSNRYLDYLRRALAFDWLYDSSAFDAALKDQVAAELLAGAERMVALQSLADPAQASYHNHSMRELALGTFAVAAVEHHPSVAAKAAPLAVVAIARQHAGDFWLVTPAAGVDGLRGSPAPLAMLAERRTMTGEDARRFGVFANGADLSPVLPTAHGRRR